MAIREVETFKFIECCEEMLQNFIDKSTISCIDICLSVYYYLLLA